MGKSKLKKGEILLYAIISFFSNLITTIVVSFVLKTILPSINNNVVIFVILLVIGVFTVSLGITALFFKRKVPKHYQASDDRYGWLKQGLRLVLPGETFRLIVCLVSLGHINSTGLLSVLPTFFFEQTYVAWSGRMEAIRQNLNFIPADFFAYIGAYLPYLILYLIGILAIYNVFWNVGKREREEMVVHESRPRFY